jgi:hypothetical protein
MLRRRCRIKQTLPKDWAEDGARREIADLCSDLRPSLYSVSILAAIHNSCQSARPLPECCQCPSLAMWRNSVSAKDLPRE